ncbi:endonuclease/exonuclease/phosphatase family protein [Rubripirellula amarantea]|nr:endonuclease/exonuclease/phosphatase family protein [Rubripirellula amarantea]
MKIIAKLPKRLRTISVAVATLLLFSPSIVCRLAAKARSVHVGQTQNPVKRLDTATQSMLRIATFNIAHGRGNAQSNFGGGSQQERDLRLARLSNLLRDSKSDIVVLNEVDFDCSWSHHMNQAQWLAENSGFSYWAEQRNFDARFLGWTWKFGNAILSQFPIDRANVVDLPAYSTWESIAAGHKRGLEVTIVDGDRKLSIIALHLSPRSESIRTNSAELVCQRIKSKPVECVVLGDMNSTLAGFPLHATTDKGHNAMETFANSGLLRLHATRYDEATTALTFPASAPNRLIDWIGVTNQLKIQNATVVESNLSDHLMVVCDVVPASLQNETK